MTLSKRLSVAGCGTTLTKDVSLLVKVASTRRTILSISAALVLIVESWQLEVNSWQLAVGS